jgi:hypothetical protein
VWIQAIVEIFLKYRIVVSYNENVAGVITKPPKTVSYISARIQKEILHIFSTKVKKAIRKKIDDAKYYIIANEARDEFMKKQIAIVLRFLNKVSFVREHFFELVHVLDITTLTLKNGIYYLLSHHNLDIQTIQGQG